MAKVDWSDVRSALGWASVRMREGEDRNIILAGEHYHYVRFRIRQAERSEQQIPEDVRKKYEDIREQIYTPSLPQDIRFKLQGIRYRRWFGSL